MAIRENAASGKSLTGVRKDFLQGWVRQRAQIMKGVIRMNDSKRVLTRVGARELSAEEVELVCGGDLHTNVITFSPSGTRDGDGYVTAS